MYSTRRWGTTRTIIIDRELQPYIVVSQGKTHNGTEVVVIDTIVKEDLMKYSNGSIRWLVDRLDVTELCSCYEDCAELTEIKLPEELPMLSDAEDMFNGCVGLKEITLPKELPMLSDTRGMFEDCIGLTEVTLSKELPMLSDITCMFFNCTGLTEVTLPERLPVLECVNSMFEDCTSLRKVTMSEEVYDKFHKRMFAGLDENEIEFVFY